MNTFCPNCGKPVENGMICPCQQTQQVQYQQPPQYQQPQYQQPQFTPQVSDNRKTYCILSYIGILWLFGLCAAPEKYDPRVRFHVGQGIILSIVGAGLSILVMIINAILLSFFSPSLYGYRFHIPTEYVAISSILNLAAFAFNITFLIIGITNVTGGKDKPLPIIGAWSFYK